MLKNLVVGVSFVVLASGCPAPKDSVEPSVTLVSSSNLLSTAGSITLTAEATDDQAVTKVALFDGEAKLIELTQAPYTHLVMLAANDNGTHQFSAKAFDAAGNAGTSNAVSVRVDIDVTPPTVSLAASLTTVIVDGTVTLTATASDNKAIAKVEFYEGNLKLSEDTAAPYVFDVSFSLLDNGGHSYTAKAIDTAGIETVSAPATVTVAIVPPPQPPIVTLTIPMKTLRFTWASVTDATRYQLFEDGDGPGSAAAVQLGADVIGTTVDHRLALHRTNPQATYHVKACNSAGCSAPSNQLGVTAALLEGIGYFKASDAASGNRFGDTVVISNDGNTMAVAGKLQDAGAVYVFTRGPAGWSQQTVLTASNAGNDDQFGFALALSDDGNTLAAGAYGEGSAALNVGNDPNDNSAPYAGSVYVFRRSGTAWSQQAWLKASNTHADDFFGLSVALSSDGNTLAVGATGEDSAATGIDGNQLDNTVSTSGAVYVFTRLGVVWSQQAYVKASNPGAEDRFGAQVALSGTGNVMAVSAVYESSDATGVDGNQASDATYNAGAVYLFTRTGTTWAQQTYLKASNTGAADNFGLGLALSRDGLTLAVGAPAEDSSAMGIGGVSDENALQSGAVYVFARSGTTWVQQTWLKASNTGAGDLFGTWLSLSSDGSLLAVGAPREASNAVGLHGNQLDDSVSHGGAAYVFSRAGTAWQQQAYVKAPNTDPAGGTLFGFGLSLSGDGSTLAVGAPGERSAATGIGGNQFDITASSAGAVYLY